MKALVITAMITLAITQAAPANAASPSKRQAIYDAGMKIELMVMHLGGVEHACGLRPMKWVSMLSKSEGAVAFVKALKLWGENSTRTALSPEAAAQYARMRGKLIASYQTGSFPTRAQCRYMTHSVAIPGIDKLIGWKW